MTKIGIFDSGLGGLSVWKELNRLLPDTDMVYVADSGRCPYGPRPTEEIISFSREITEFLISEGCGLIIVGCNTATAASIRILRKEYQLPFVGMEPALKPAVAASRTGVIGILATEGTFRGTHFQDTKATYAADATLLLQVGHRLVDFVETGQLTGDDVRVCLEAYLLPMLEKKADQIVLGCSHYPFLKDTMNAIVGDQARIIDPAPAVARQAAKVWANTGYPSAGNGQTFFSSGDLQQLKGFLSVIAPAQSYDVRKLYRPDSPFQNPQAG